MLSDHDREQLRAVWTQHAPLPEEGMTDRVVEAMLAVARWGETRTLDALGVPYKER